MRRLRSIVLSLFRGHALRLPRLLLFPARLLLPSARLLLLPARMLLPAGCSSVAIATEVAAQRWQPPVIIAFNINSGAASASRSLPLLRLVHELTGVHPYEYRVSARADFAGASWLPYSAALQLSGWTALIKPGAHCDGALVGQRLILFLQVRAEIGGAVRIVNGQRVVVPQKVESNVVSASVCATA